MRHHSVYYFHALLLMAVLVGCGGGGGNNGILPSPTPPVGTFSLVVSPTVLPIAPGVVRSIQVKVNSQGGFFGSVSITASGLPASVNVSPVPLVVNANQAGTLTIAPSSSVASGSATVTLQGTSGGLQATTPLTLQVNPLAIPASRPFKLVGGSIQRGFYDEARGLLFATNPLLNEVDVISGTDLTIQARLSVPAPIGIDQMADGSTLIVGTLTQALYTVDENTLAVVQHLAPNFSFFGSTTLLVMPVAMANGKVLLIGNEEGLFIGYIFGGSHLIEWDPAADTFTEVTLSSTFPKLGFELDNIKRSADHKWAILGSDQLYLYSSDTDSFTSTTLPPDLRDVAANADGTRFAVSLAHQINFYDRNFVLLGSSTVSEGVFTHTGLRYSPDSTRLYWPVAGTAGSGNITDVVNATTFSEIGHIGTVIGPAQDEAILLAVDSNQRAFYGAAAGVATLTLDALSTSPTQSDVNFGFFPSAAPLNVALPVSFTSINVPPGISITVGGAPVTIQSFDPVVKALIPPSAGAGPADIIFTFPDGEVFLKPLSFSYGLTLETPTATLVPTTGNPTIGVVGFGFNDPLSQLPTISIGGQPATNIVANPNTSGILQELFFTVPSAGAGPADITVSGTKGSAARTSALTYVSTSIVPATGLLQLLYDSHRNLVYALTSTQVDVFNPTTGLFQSPLVPSTAAGLNYVAMALTPDGSKLLMVDTTNSTLTIFNPDNPTSNTVTALPDPPSGVAVTSTGKAFMGSSLGSIEFDLATLTPTFQEGVPSFGPMKFVATPDGTHLVAAMLFNTSGTVAAWNSSTDTFVSQGFIDGLWTDIAISNDGSQFAAIAGEGFDPGTFVGFFDEQVHFLNATVYPDLAPPDSLQAEGGIFSPGGTVLLQPVFDAIELFDTKTGKLRARLMTPEPLVKLTFPILSVGVAVNPTGQTICAISTSGLTLFHLSTPVDQLAATIWPLSPLDQFKQSNSSGLLQRHSSLLHIKK
jgi:hypothetical protein